MGDCMASLSVLRTGLQEMFPPSLSRGLYAPEMPLEALPLCTPTPRCSQISLRPEPDDSGGCCRWRAPFSPDDHVALITCVLYAVLPGWG